MLAELVSFSERVALIVRSGIQFLDFGLTLDLRREAAGEFAPQASRGSLARLEYDTRADRHVHPGNPGQAVRPALSVPVDESFRLLNGCWLPLPYLRAGRQRQFADGPTTWARARILALAPREDLLGHTHRLTVAFDTTVFEDAEDTAYLAPTHADVQSGAAFQLAHRAHEIGWFTDIPWIAEWIREVFVELGPERLRLPVEDVEAGLKELRHHAHYLNWVAMLGRHARLPEIVIRSNAPADVRSPIPVDLVLDIGNSRTCGILIEDHPQQGHGLKNRYELALRDLTQPHRLYAEPFESRVEFAQVVFGKEHLACQSGRGDAFVWPTITRVGPEAAWLASRRRGTEGATGLSSPKRYLWDEERFAPGWRFNVSVHRSDIEPHATGAPFSNLINDLGEALYTLPAEERMPVFLPHYSRSALMTFMLAEVLAQALGQINSAAQRLKQGDPEKPRHLRSIILTVPPSMPKPEREIFTDRVRQAVALVWKALGWHPEDDPPDAVDADGRSLAWPPFPAIHMQWDEATCAQVVFLFSESQEHFGGRPEDLFPLLRKPHARGEEKRLTVASLDIGGGTTDLVVTDYRLDRGPGAQVYILPEQRFRDGFKLAGDDLLLEVVQRAVIPAIHKALRAHGVADPAALLSRLIGAEGGLSVQERALRQQVTLQVLYPLGLIILKEYEHYEPVTGAQVRTRSIGEWLAGREPPSSTAIGYFAGGVARDLDPPRADFDLLAVPLTIDLDRLHGFFLAADDHFEIRKTIQALCEIVHMYDCDVLLLTGRPSRLPGVQALIRMLLPLPPDRIVPLHGYRAGVWYPFHRGGRIDDPKTTAAVGAMLCRVGGDRRIPNFNFLANAFAPSSTIRYVGTIDMNLIIKDEEVYYRDVRLDDPDYALPDTPFEVRGRMVLGFRQLDSERWGASPLYVLDLSERARERLERADRREPAVLDVTLKRDTKRRAERFDIDRVECKHGGVSVSRGDVQLSLNTLRTAGLGEVDYWLDTGSVFAG